jgi:deoxyribodipyrimidine photo-lyase
MTMPVLPGIAIRAAGTSPVYFDTDILYSLEDKDDRRVEFMLVALSICNSTDTPGQQPGYSLRKPPQVYKDLLTEYDVKEVVTNHDYEPYARQRDEAIGEWLKEKGCAFSTYKDQVVFEKN